MEKIAQQEGKNQPTSPDEQYALLSPLKDALHLFVRMVLLELPENAKILIVGAGTGPEVIYLGQAFPKFQFMVVEPNSVMLNKCQQKCEENKIINRCKFHEGTIDSLRDNEMYNAATSILVSHYLPGRDGRIRFFHEIASKLNSKGVLVSADLISKIPLTEPESLMNLWSRTMQYANSPLPPRLPAISPEEMCSIISEAGFGEPTYFYQALLIHAWFSKKRTN